ncbi:hypothetical protein ACIQI7_21425 [Kitasatospora sp. NPDC092039]
MPTDQAAEESAKAQDRLVADHVGAPTAEHCHARNLARCPQR